MEDNLLKIGIIGPTNMEKLAALTEKTEEFFLQKADALGEIFAKQNCELWINSDRGMGSNIAISYKNHGGKKLVVLVPKEGVPWPNMHVVTHQGYADEISEQPNWFWTNYQVTAIPDICVCAGLSAGALSELAYIKWNRQFKQGNLRRLVVIQEFVRGRRIPPEIEADVEDMLVYLDSVEDVDGFLREEKDRA